MQSPVLLDSPLPLSLFIDIEKARLEGQEEGEFTEDEIQAMQIYDKAIFDAINTILADATMQLINLDQPWESKMKSSATARGKKGSTIFRHFSCTQLSTSFLCIALKQEGGLRREIICEELYHRLSPEEPDEGLEDPEEWSSYYKDERILKKRVADIIFRQLLEDTVLSTVKALSC